MADAKPKTDPTQEAKIEQKPKLSTESDGATKSEKVDEPTKTKEIVAEKKKDDATVGKKENKNADEKKDSVAISEKKEETATKDDKTTNKKKDDATSNKSDDKKKDEPVNKTNENDKTNKKKEDEKTNKKNDEEKTSKKNDNTSTTKKSDNSKVANNINKTEGGKPRAGSTGNQGKANQSNEQKMKRRQKEQDRYQRKIQRGENKYANKEGGAQKATSKMEGKKESGGLSITLEGEGRTVTEKRDGKTVVEKKGENAIEAPETKQGGDALTEEEKKLEEHQIFRLAKKSLRFPKAKFYCRYCNYHLDTVDLAFKHVDESRHSKLEKTKNDQEFLRTLPPASDAHHEALTDLLTSIVNKHKLSQQDLDQRAQIVTRVEQVLRKELPKCQVRLYGSSMSGFGFKDSNVNLDIQMPPEVTPAEILVGTDKAMHKHSADVFTEVVTDFEGKFPCINFKDKKTGLQCQVGTNSQFAVDTSKLLLEYYKLDARVPVLALSLRYWAQLCKVDQQADGSMPAYAFVLMVIHFLQQCDPPALPVIQEKEKLKEQNTKGVGELWLDMLKFYVVETPIEEWVITIRNRKPISRQDMKIPNKRLAVEDPFGINKKNITKSLTTSIVFQYIMERLREALKYFGLPQYLPGKEPTASNCYSWFVHSKSPTNKSIPGDKPTTNATDSTKDSVDELAKDLSKKLVTDHAGSHRTNAAEATPKGVTSTSKTPEKGSKDATDGQQFGPSVSDFKFVFEKEILTGGEEVPLICSGCGLEGHVEKDCQDEVLIDLIPLPPMPPNFMHKIDMLCVNICEEVQAQRWEMEARDNIIWELQSHIRRNGFPDTNLRLFGSSMNGFGFHHSDLDICMTLKGATDPKSLNFPEIVEKLAKILKKNRSLYGITPIPTAKVPIVKFVHRPSRLEGDISLYNMLAQVNTKMLFCYSSIDPRVRQLVYAFKLFAKICDIGDASKGSLSSYAYTLMTLFFLQQRKPPVIPSLQELYPGKEKPKAMMEGWNAWFYEDMRSLPRAWKEYGRNRESVGLLWLGMLRFYTEDFDFKKFVITIRQLKPLTRFEKMWTAPSRGFAIEDPFDLDHNLGGGVSRKMATYMMQVLRKTRERFGLPRRIPPYTDDFDYFFDVEFLSDGKAPPNDRGCRVCGKIGHFVKECPRRRPKGGDSNDRKRDDGKGSPIKQMRDASPKKSEPQKETLQKVPSNNTQSNKETPKKAGPEKEILKRDTSAQKTPNGKASTPVSVTPVMSNSKAAQIQHSRPATLTPTTKPLIPPSTSAVSVTTAVGNQASTAAGASKEAGDGTTSSEKQRTNSIGDTWEQHKTGKKTSKKKKKKSTDDPGPQGADNQTKVPTSQSANQPATPTTQATQQPSTQSPATTQGSAQKTPVSKTSQPATQPSSAPATSQRAGILPINHLNQANRPTIAPGGYPKGGGNQKIQGQGMQQPFKGPLGMQQQQKVPQVGQQKGPQGTPQKGQQGQQGAHPQQRNQQQMGPQGLQQQQQQQPPRNPQGILSWMPGGIPQGIITPQQKALQQAIQQQQQQQQRAQAGPRGTTPNQKPSSPQKTPYNPNQNQKYPQKQDQKTPQPQKMPTQPGQKGNQKGQQQGKNQGKGQQKTPQKNAPNPGEPPVPTLAQGPGQKHVPFSKKRLPKGPNLSQEQQAESRKALLAQMSQGLMTMLQTDKAQRTALKKAELHHQVEDVGPQSRGSQHHVSNMGDKRGQVPSGSGGIAGGSGGAFQKYPVHPQQLQKSFPPPTSTVASTSPKKVTSAPGPATLQSNLPLEYNAGDSFNNQLSPTDLGFSSAQYPSYESPQKTSPSAIGRSPPKFPVQPPPHHSPGTLGIGHQRMSSPGVNATDVLPQQHSSMYQPMRYSNVPKSEISPPGGMSTISHNQSRFLGGTQSPVEINQFQIPREEPELPVFGSSPSKHAVNVEGSPPGFMGGSGGNTAPGEHPHQQQHSLHHMMGMNYPMEHMTPFAQGNVPGSGQDAAKSSPRDFHAQMFQQGRSPEDVNPYQMIGNQPVPIGMRAAMARFNSEDSPQGFNPERQAPGNQPQSLATSSGLGMSPAKFQVGGVGGSGFDASTWLHYSSMAPSSATSQAPMRYPTSNNMPFGNLNTSPGTPPFLNYSTPGNPYASNPSQLVGGMPPSPPSNQLHQASAVFGANNPSQLGVSPSPPNTQLFQGNLFGTPGVIGSPAGVPYTSSPATMHMYTNDSGLGLGYGSTESSVASQSSVGDRLYREAVTLATTSSSYPAFPGGTASNAAVPTHINVHPKPAVLPYVTPTYAPHQMASLYNSEGQPMVHGEVEGQNVIGQSPR